MLAANHLYNVSPKDGSELGLIAGSAAIEPVFGARKTQFNGQKFTWLGSANEEISGCFAWHTTRFHDGAGPVRQGAADRRVRRPPISNSRWR